MSPFTSAKVPILSKDKHPDHHTYFTMGRSHNNSELLTLSPFLQT